MVEHTQWGPGTVSVVESGKVTVLFEERGYVTLDTAIALDGGLPRGGSPHERAALGLIVAGLASSRATPTAKSRTASD